MKSTVKLILCSTALIGAVGCSSWIESSRKMIDDEEAKQRQEQQKKMSKWVPRAKYDDLVIKYKNLSEKYQATTSTQNNKSKFDQIDELAKSTGHAHTETVDVFGKGGLEAEVEKVSAVIDSGSVTSELQSYKKGLALKTNGKVDDALKVFQYLERSKVEQIQVRARMQIGSIYLEKNQFDLSLQVFEQIITSNAFSGKVLDALKGAVLSCDGLGLTDKKLRYRSMLKDFFGINS